MPRLEVSSRAERDIDDLYRFGIVQYGLRLADDYVQLLHRRMGQLEQFPLLGVERSDVRPNIRLLVFKAHNIPYRVISNRVLIVRVLHRAADWANLL